MEMFARRIYTTAAFAADLRDLFEHLGDLRGALRSGRVDRAFAERVMMSVTQVNGCRYCSFVHTRAALAAGVTEAEMRGIAARAFGDVPPEQVTALMFAQHYADTRGHPDAEAWQRMIAVYGADVTRDLMVYIRMINLANLWGNTFDALLSRIAGRPAPGSSLWDELGVLAGWVIIAPVCAVDLLIHARQASAVAPYDRPASTTQP